MKYYLDIETSGLDYVNDRILTIQTALIDETKKEFKNFHIRVAWDEEDEEKIVKNFWEWYSYLFNKFGLFGVIPVGYNIQFDLTFLFYKAKKYKVNLPINNFYEYIFRTPSIDLRNIVIIMNFGSFKGTSLSNVTTKKNDGDAVLKYLTEKNYKGITNYIIDETKAFQEFYFWLLDHLPYSFTLWKKESRIKHESSWGAKIN